MLNTWALIFLSFVVVALFILFRSNTPYLTLIISEFNWVCLISLSLILAQFNNDPRFYILTFLFLFMAALEVVTYLLYTIVKNN